MKNYFALCFQNLLPNLSIFADFLLEVLTKIFCRTQNSTILVTLHHRVTENCTIVSKSYYSGRWSDCRPEL